MLFLTKITILHIIDSFGDHTMIRKKKLLHKTSKNLAQSGNQDTNLIRIPIIT